MCIRDSNKAKSLDEEKIQQVISSRCEPPIPITVEIVNLDGIDIGIITIFDGGQKPYQIKETGAFHIRRGSITDIMRKSELVAAFEENQLEIAEFIHTSLNGLDFSNCKIDGIVIPMENLKGLSVSPEQALQLATLLGLKIKHL